MGFNRDYASTKAIAVENWFWNLPSRDAIRKSSAFCDPIVFLTEIMQQLWSA
jgi:hypothetical protein